MAAISIAPATDSPRRRLPLKRAQKRGALRISDFSDYFDFGLATTPRMRESTFRIRGDVYGKEFHYEPEENCPGGLETDSFDADALHLLITHRERAIPAGCVRLILPETNGPTSTLPLESGCSYSLTHPHKHPQWIARENQVEISRLAVHSIFRRRSGEHAAPDGMSEIQPFGDDERRSFPLIGNALALASLALADLVGREHIFVMMEPRLARLLKHIGLEFTQVGNLIEYHGYRAAFYLNTEKAILSIKPEVRDLFSFLQRKLWRDLYSALDTPVV